MSSIPINKKEGVKFTCLVKRLIYEIGNFETINNREAVDKLFLVGRMIDDGAIYEWSEYWLEFTSMIMPVRMSVNMSVEDFRDAIISSGMAS